jgi:two-component system response regulator QseB
MHLLIIEDDIDFGFSLQQALKAEGISSVWLRRLAEAPRLLSELDYDCALLDVALPDGNGFDLLTHWRSIGLNIPIMMITARSGLADKVAGLDGGADDFIVKPFAMAELLSRLRAVLRRYAHQTSQLWTIGQLKIDPRGHRVWLEDTELELLRREFQLVIELAREPGVVVPKGILAQRLEPLGDALTFSLLEVHISNLRRKIGADRVRTVRGVGYMLVP